MCKISSCHRCKPGKNHYCKNCQNIDSDHRSSQCPLGSASSSHRKRCKVIGCIDCKPGKSHYCKNCGNLDSTHRSSQCPNILLIVEKTIHLSSLGVVSSLSIPINHVKISDKYRSQNASLIVLIIDRHNNFWILVYKRNITGKFYNETCTAGGACEGKTVLQTIREESFEETGICLDGVEIYHLQSTPFCIMGIVVLKLEDIHKCSTNGPLPRHKFEVSNEPMYQYHSKIPIGGSIYIVRLDEFFSNPGALLGQYLESLSNFVAKLL